MRNDTLSPDHENDTSSQLLQAQQKIETLSTRIEELTEREQEVVDLIIEGKTTAEISEILKRSPHTINSHRKNILKKLNIKTPLELLKLTSEQSI